MIVDGYDGNPYPYEVGDILLDKEESSLAVLTGANYGYIHLFQITGSPHGHCDDRIDASREEYMRVGHLDAQGMQALLRESGKGQ